MKPTIIQVVQHLRPGGIETMALDLARQFGQYCNVHIVSLEGDKHQAIAAWPRLRPFTQQLHFLGKQPGLRISLVKTLADTFRNLNATAVHSHHIGPLFYTALAARLAGIDTHVHTEHDAWHLNAPSNRRLQGSLLRLLPPRLVADCNAVAEVLTRLFPFSAPDVIVNGVDTQHFTPVSEPLRQQARARLGIPVRQGLLIGCAARLEAVKGHEFLLQALSHTHYPINLALAGDGSLRKHLERRVEELGLKQRVYFLGNLDNMLPFYHALNLFCLPSLNEGLPLSPLEAQACGIPVIVSRVGGCESIVCPHTGELVAPGNVQALSDALMRHCCVQMSHSPRAFVLQSGNLRQTASSYLDLLAPGVRSTPCLN